MYSTSRLPGLIIVFQAAESELTAGSLSAERQAAAADKVCSPLFLLYYSQA